MIGEEILDKIKDTNVCIFEFDGTIADTRADHSAACENVLSKMNVKMSEGAKKKYKNQPELQYFKMVIKDYQLNASAAECVKNKRAEFEEIIQKRGVRIFPWIKEIAPSIKDKRTLVFTSLPSKTVKSVMEKQGLSDIFPTIWSLPEIGASKVSTIKEMAGYSPVYFDDENKFLTTAKESGIISVGIIHSQNRETVLDCDYLIDTTKR